MKYLFIICTLVCSLFFPTKAQINFKPVGKASYYSNTFNGHKTASGEIYNSHKFTAAHPSIPFNTILKVTNVKTKKTVFVRINDRGPYTKKRIIDLSEAAAKELGILEEGIAKVKIEVADSNELLIDSY